MTTSPPEHPIHIGLVVAAHGITGALKVKTADPAPDWLASPPPLWAKRKGQTQLLPCQCVQGQLLKPSVVVLNLADVKTRTLAEAWVGAELYLDPAHLPAPQDDDTFRAFELEGMTVLAADTGEALGTVTALAYSPGGQSFIEVALQPHGVVRLIPFTHTFIPSIDRVAKTLTVQGLEAFLREEALMVPVPKKPKFIKGKAKTKRPPQAFPTPSPETPPAQQLT